MSLGAVPVVNLIYKETQGFESSWVSNTTLSIAAGQTRDSTNVFDIALSAVTVLDAATTGLNGLDTGALAATKLYKLFVIGDPQSGLPTGLLLSLSDTPLMPMGYLTYKKIGYWATDASSHFLLGYNAGSYQKRRFMYDAVRATAVTAGNATSFTNVSLAELVPAVDNTNIYAYVDLTPGAAGRALSLQAAGATGTATGTVITGQVTAVHVTGTVEVMAKLVTAVPNIAYKVANSGDACAISVAGFDYEV